MLFAAHFREIALLGLHPHLNSTYALLVALQRYGSIYYYFSFLCNKCILRKYINLNTYCRYFRRFNLIESKDMEVLSDLEQALHLTDDVSTTAIVASNNNSSSSCNSSCNINSNTVTVTQAIISSSPLRSIGGTTSTSINSPLDGGLNVHNNQIDEVTVIVKQPLISDSATSMLNNNNDFATKDRVLAVDTQPI